MAVWNTQPVTAQPHLTLANWQVHELSDGARVLVGYCSANLEGRTSSEIAEIDLQTLNCRTGSGRVYRLYGPPGSHPDADYVFKAWKHLNRETETTDVTQEVWQDHLAACSGTALSRNGS
ncbi:hypothetical protein [Diaphorobacter sp.]|uniref:hypothetical protein n=1 Tax=Diaphorobacter sp. TaxID=1934310 RepID=UPI00258F1E90|nr:hypothetical protein [Diaphorobacter sp.]